MKTIVIAEDHPFTLLGTKTFVEGLGYHIVDLCSDGITAFNCIVSRQPDIALLDINMPGMNAIEILENLQQHRVKTKIVLLTMHNENSIFNRAVALGAKGYLLKEFATEELEICLKNVSNNDLWFSEHLKKHLEFSASNNEELQELSKLSAAEKKIVNLIAEQYTTKEIAQLLYITEKTVENHRSNIIHKLDLPKEKNGLLKWALKNIDKSKNDNNKIALQNKNQDTHKV
jgi:DNA-binding NarL/FixJ family response regulator